MRECVYCGSEKIIKHGYHQKGPNKIQRYKCRKCKKTFCEGSNGIAYDRITNRVLKLLFAISNNNFFDKTDIIEAIREAYKISKKTIDERKIMINHIKPSKDEFECFPPKVLLSVYNNRIILYSLSDFSASKIKLT